MSSERDRKNKKKRKRFDPDTSTSESESSPNEETFSESDSSSNEEEDAKAALKKKNSEEEELLIHEDVPFEIIPPPQQPAGLKRKGTGYINANLPQPPFMVLMVGPRKTGKTVTLYNMLSKKKGAYGNAFIRNNIILYSPTMQFDKTLEGLHLKWTYGPPTTVDSIVAHIKQEQTVFKQTNSMADVLLVLEDVTNIPEVWNTLKDLGFTGRHFGIHTIAIAHKMSSINRGVRTQTQQWMLFKPHEESEVEWILYSFARRKTREIFEAAFSRAWDIRFNFIYIDFERDGGIENIYRSGFNEPLFTPEEINMLTQIRLYKPDGGVAVDAPQDDDPLPAPRESPALRHSVKKTTTERATKKARTVKKKQK